MLYPAELRAHRVADTGMMYLKNKVCKRVFGVQRILYEKTAENSGKVQISLH